VFLSRVVQSAFSQYRPSRRFARLGIDSWLVLLTYVLGMAGLVFVKNGG